MPMSIREKEAYAIAFAENFSALLVADLEVHHYPEGFGQQKFYELHRLLAQVQQQLVWLHKLQCDSAPTEQPQLFDEELYDSKLYSLINYYFALIVSFILWLKNISGLWDQSVKTNAADKASNIDQQIETAYAAVENIEWLLVSHLEDLLQRSRDPAIESESQVKQLNFWQRHAERFAEIDRILNVLPDSPMRNYYEMARWKNHIKALEKYQDEMLADYVHLLYKFSNPALYSDETQMVKQLRETYARFMLEAASFVETLNQAKKWYADLSSQQQQYADCFKQQQRFYELKGAVKQLTEETKISYDLEGRVYKELVAPLRRGLEELARQGYVPAVYELSKLGCGLDDQTAEEDAYLEQAVRAGYPLAKIDFCEKVSQTREDQEQRTRDKTLEKATLRAVFELAQVHGNSLAYGVVQAVIDQGHKITEQLAKTDTDIRDISGSHAVVMRHILEVCSHLADKDVCVEIITAEFPPIFEIDLTEEAQPISTVRGKGDISATSCAIQARQPSLEQGYDSLPRLVY